MKMIKNFKEGLSKNVIILGIVSGLTDISSEMLYPVIPIFLSQFLKAPMTVIGLIEGIAESTASILKIWGGYISDRFRKRKPFIIIGYFLSAVSKPIMAFAGAWQFVLFARFIDRVGKGIRTSPRDALIAASSDKEHWGKAFGFHRAMDTTGAAFGPIITLLLFLILSETEKSYRIVFLIAFIPAILGVFILKKYIKDEGEITKTETLKTQTATEPLSYDFKIFTFIYILFSIGKFSDAFLIMKTKSIVSSTTHTIMVYFAYNILYAFLSTPAGIIADKIGKVKVFMLSFLIFAIVCFGFSKTATPYGIWLFFLIYSFYGALNEGIAKAIISNLTTSNNRASGMGVFQGFSGIAVFLSSLLAGVLWDKFEPSTPFLFSSITSILSLILLFIWIKWRKINI
ncbi:MAG: MFS transporter [Elusimicrobiales bacterium]|jgi:MFS family permease